MWENDENIKNFGDDILFFYLWFVFEIQNREFAVIFFRSFVVGFSDFYLIIKHAQMYAFAVIAYYLD